MKIIKKVLEVLVLFGVAYFVTAFSTLLPFSGIKLLFLGFRTDGFFKGLPFAYESSSFSHPADVLVSYLDVLFWFVVLYFLLHWVKKVVRRNEKQDVSHATKI